MNKVIVCVIAALLSAGMWSAVGIADTVGQDDKASAGKQHVEKIGMAESKKIVAAKVNGVDITLDEVIMLANRFYSQKANAHVPVETIQREALDSAVLQELAYQHAKAAGMAVEQKEVDAALGDMKVKAGGEEKFAKLLEDLKVNEAQFRAQVEKNLILEAVYKKEVLGKVSVPEEKITEEYEKNKISFTTPEKTSIVDVTISGKDAETRAEDILKKINESGNDPRKLASDSTFTVGDRALNKEKDKELIEAARKMKPGDISDIIKTGDSVHIIKLLEYTPEKTHPLDEVKDYLEKKLRTDEQKGLTREWFSGLKKNAKIEIIVHEAQKGSEQNQK